MKCSVFILLLLGLCAAEIPEIPELDDLEDLKERCDTKGGTGTFEKVKVAKNETETCLKKLIDVEKFKNEIEEAKKTGSMDEVFAKYCNKRSEMEACIRKTYNALEPCLESNEKQVINFTANILKQLGDFVCAKDGDRLAMFVAEGGVTCIKSRSEGIKDCLNQTLKFNPATFSPESMHSFTIDKKKCDDITSIQNCIVKDLEENCEESTPANIIDALFRFVKRSACKDVKRRRSVSLKRQLRSTFSKTQESFASSDVLIKLRDLCKKNGNEGSFDMIKNSSVGVLMCLGNYKMFNTPINELDAALVRCTADIRRISLDCLSDSQKYYPDFVLQILRNLLRFAYENSDFIQGRTAEWEHAICLNELHRKDNRNKIFKCFEKASKNNECEEGFYIPPKDELCRQVKDFSTCFLDVIKRICIRDIKTDKFIDGGINALESPCMEERNWINE
nr:uncharacterized protein LOC111508663 [Leptinotarsa decemlineata]